MKTFSTKNLLIIFLLLHGIVINFIFFPVLFAYSRLSNVNYLNLDEWVKSICINFLFWQVLDYLSNENNGQFNGFHLRSELKKIPILIKLNKLFFKISSSERLRNYTLNLAIWLIIIFNLVVPILLVFVFHSKLNFTFFCLWFILFQIVFFIFFYLNKYFPEAEDKYENKFQSPWFIDIVVLKLLGNKS